MGKLLIVVATTTVLLGCGHGSSGTDGPTLEEDILAFEARDWPRPPAFGDPVPGTAWEHYFRAFDAMDAIGAELGEEDRDQAWSEIKSWSFDDARFSDLARALAADAHVVFANLEKGARTSRAGRFFDIRLGIGISEEGDNDRPIKESIRLNGLSWARLEVLLDQGATSQILDQAIALARLGSDLGRGAPGLHQFVGHTVRTNAILQAGRLLRDGDLTEAELSRMERWAAGLPSRPDDWWDVIDPELLTMRVTHDRLGSGVDRLPDLEPESEADAEETRVLYMRLSELLGVILREVRVEHPDGDPSDVSEEIGSVSTNWSLRLALSEPGTAAALKATCGMVTVPLDRMVGVWEESHVRREALLLGIALVEFHRRESRYPATLEEVRPASVREDAPITYRAGDEARLYLDFEVEEAEEDGEEAEPFLRLE